MIKKLSDLLFHTKSFFKRVEKEKTYWAVLKVFLILTIISLILSLLKGYNLIAEQFSALPIASAFASMGIIGLSIFSILFSLLAVFIGSFLVHLGVLIFGGKKGYYNTFKPVGYGMILSAIYGVILGAINLVLYWLFSVDLYVSVPFLMFIVSIWILIHVLYAYIIGIAKFQKITKLKAFLGIIIVPIILFILTILVLIFAKYFLSQYAGSFIG